MKFSESTNAFYDGSLKYADAPDDLIEVSAGDFALYTSPAPSGKVRGSVNGLPSWVDAPEPEPPTVAERIEALEATVTPRNIRGWLRGDEWAIEHIEKVDDQIAELRAK